MDDDVCIEASCPLCKGVWYVTWESGDGVREQPTCPNDGLPLIAQALFLNGGEWVDCG